MSSLLKNNNLTNSKSTVELKPNKYLKSNNNNNKNNNNSNNLTNSNDTLPKTNNF